MFDCESKLNLLFGKRCNNRCLFCLDSSGDVQEGDDEIVVRTVDEAVAAMQRDRDRRGGPGGTVAFGRLEVALERDFVDVVRAARDLGYGVRHLTSNGRLLGKRSVLERLVDAGVNYITVSIHAPTAAVHDALSGRRRAFEQTVAGLENIVALRRERAQRGDEPLTLALATTVTGSNVALLSEHYAFLQRFTPELIGLNALLYSGRATEFLEELSFPYTTLERELLRLLDENRDALHTRMAVLGVPFCALERVPMEIVGLRESFHMLREEDGGGDGDWLETGAAGEGGFGLLHVPACETCSMRRYCPGPAAEYVARHGDGEIHPLGDDYPSRAREAASLFPSGPYRYPVRDPRALPDEVQRAARALAQAGRPGWRLVGVSAVAHEHQAAHRLIARYEEKDGARLVVEVEPCIEGSDYFRRAGRWGVTLADGAEEQLPEREALARERLIERITAALARLEGAPTAGRPHH